MSTWMIEKVLMKQHWLKKKKLKEFEYRKDCRCRLHKCKESL